MWFSQNSRENLVHSAVEFSEDHKYFRFKFKAEANNSAWHDAGVLFNTTS